MEIWKQIPGFDKYKVSNLGRVKSIRREIIDINKNKRLIKEKILKVTIDKNGYFSVGLYKNSDKPKMLRVHRLVLLAFNGQSFLACNHKDLDKTNNKLENLEYVTNKENTAHARSLKKWGHRDAKHFNSKVGFKELVEILYMRALSVPTKAISFGYGIREDYIKSLKYRANYKKAMKEVKQHLRFTSPTLF